MWEVPHAYLVRSRQRALEPVTAAAQDGLVCLPGLRAAVDLAIGQ